MADVFVRIGSNHSVALNTHQIIDRLIGFILYGASARICIMNGRTHKCHMTQPRAHNHGHNHHHKMSHRSSSFASGLTSDSDPREDIATYQQQEDAVAAAAYTPIGLPKLKLSHQEIVFFEQLNHKKK
eukprot:724192_1